MELRKKKSVIERQISSLKTQLKSVEKEMTTELANTFCKSPEILKKKFSYHHKQDKDIVIQIMELVQRIKYKALNHHLKMGLANLIGTWDENDTPLHYVQRNDCSFASYMLALLIGQNKKGYGVAGENK